ncbi:hypothetical protein FACS1894105_13430 [Clostridia bacterium]|nr:hypothetical protein FACS1894105_13430 [Clostridia bacterium]
MTHAEFKEILMQDPAFRAEWEADREDREREAAEIAAKIARKKAAGKVGTRVYVPAGTSGSSKQVYRAERTK